MELEQVKRQIIDGLNGLDHTLAPYREVAAAVTELGAPDLVTAYVGYEQLHDLYQDVIAAIQAAESPEAVLEAYRRLSPEPPSAPAPEPVPAEEGVSGISLSRQ